MSEKGGAAAAVNALIAKAKLAGMWREKVDQHNTGSPERPTSDIRSMELGLQTTGKNSGL